ncbi:MAG: hypothetical protein LBU60_01150 [Clostridiales bacterium]|jgi:hypothetical protein|nr:hypothetical protein [Clostridiales bacterium]
MSLRNLFREFVSSALIGGVIDEKTYSWFANKENLDNNFVGFNTQLRFSRV